MTDQGEMDADVVVVGAGISGLSAAYHLLKKDPGLKVLVLEAKDRVGGRTLTVDLKSASGLDAWDLGGQWVGSTQPHILSLLKELDLEVYRQYDDGYRFMQLGSGKIGTYKSDIPSLPWMALIELHMFMNKVEALRKEIKGANPLTCSLAQELDSITVDQYAKQHLSYKEAHDALAAAGRCIFGAEPNQMSMLYYLVYASAAGGLDPLISAKPNCGGQEFKIMGGAQQISHCLVEKIGTSKVLLSRPVVAIEQGDSYVILTTLGGHHLTSRRVVMALPPHQAAKIEYNPPLPGDKLHLFQRMPVGHIIKVLVTYKEPFWRDRGACGEVCTSGGPSVVADCDTGPLCIVFDATSGNDNPALVGFIGGDQAVQYHKVSVEERKKAVLHSLSQFFGPQVQEYLDYIEKDWHTETYNGGGPVSIGTTGTMMSWVPGLRYPFQRLHFAGTESASVWCGFMNGAVQAGIRAANEVLYNERPEAVTSEDLVGTAYDPTVTSTKLVPQRAAGSSHRLLKWSLGIGGVCLALYIAKKANLKSYL